MAAVYEEHSRLGHAPTEEHQAAVKATIAELVAKRGLKLGNKSFRKLLDECLSNLYIHATSVEDLKRTVEEKNEEE